jgi:hypothetical protein
VAIWSDRTWAAGCCPVLLPRSDSSASDESDADVVTWRPADCAAEGRSCWACAQCAEWWRARLGLADAADVGIDLVLSQLVAMADRDSDSMTTVAVVDETTAVAVESNLDHYH